VLFFIMSLRNWKEKMGEKYFNGEELMQYRRDFQAATTVVKLYGTGTGASRHKTGGGSAELEEGAYRVMKNSSRLVEGLVFMCTAGK
jgi:hypothetical protein